jgi:hypothetical protein
MLRGAVIFAMDKIRQIRAGQKVDSTAVLETLGRQLSEPRATNEELFAGMVAPELVERVAPEQEAYSASARAQNAPPQTFFEPVPLLLVRRPLRGDQRSPTALTALSAPLPACSRHGCGSRARRQRHLSGHEAAAGLASVQLLSARTSVQILTAQQEGKLDGEAQTARRDVKHTRPLGEIKSRLP